MLSCILATNDKPVINCCIWLVDSFECVKMHGPTNPKFKITKINPLNAELNPICCLLASLGAHYFLHVSRIRVKLAS